MQSYYIPKHSHKTEIVVDRSRFITTIDYADTVDTARHLISDIKTTMSDANHHVYAFRIGYGNTVTEGMSDNGEPTGTAGSPTLAVLRGADIGDIVCVTTRYFGGKKLGTGGLVKAYTESVQTALETLELEFLESKTTFTMQLPYHLYNIVKSHISEFDLTIEDEEFMELIRITIKMREVDHPRFMQDLIEKTSAQVEFIDQAD